MQSFRRYLLLFAATMCTAYGYSDSATSVSQSDITDEDLKAMRDYMNSKKNVTVKDLGGGLTISGEVRVEFQNAHEKLNGEQLRGVRRRTFANSKEKSEATRSYDIELNLLLDYRADRTWASVKLEFDHAAGITTGTETGVDLERAYFGARAVQGDSYVFDIEIGRRGLGQPFDSKVQFDSRFDGILVKYDQAIEAVGDFYTHVGAFVINERVDHYGYVGELGLLNIAKSGFYTKYSLIDWDTKDLDRRHRRRFREGETDRDRERRLARDTNRDLNRLYDYFVSQFLVGYRFVPVKFQKSVLLYAAILVNHAARRHDYTHDKKLNMGGYAGFTLGTARKQGDWALDVNYQIIQAQAIPSFDVSGIGLRNISREGLTTNSNTSGPATLRRLPFGNTNYQGYILELGYLFTDNLLIQQSWQQSFSLNNDIGVAQFGNARTFNQYELEFIYAF
ncbi:MAG: hypothetical protein HKM07_02530 [Chlamydiae bacterium]|nr:hypothetical protein [Chlamydiota bacterium]